jgi:hypothetical protein
MRLAGAAAFVIALWLSGVQLGRGEMSELTPIQQEKIQRFKDRIDFDAKVRVEPPGWSVILELPDMLTAPGIANQGWSVAGDTTFKKKYGALRKWGLNRGEATLAIDVFVSSAGTKAAREFFLEESANTMMVDIPYSRGPEGIGTLCVSQLRPPTSSSVLWLFHNVYTRVRGTQSPIDVVAIARWLQGQYQEHLVAGDGAGLDTLPKLLVSPERLTVGEAVQISLNDPRASNERYLIRTDADEQSVSELRYPGPRVELIALAPGPATVNVHLIDQNTLLLSTTRLELDILAPSS